MTWLASGDVACMWWMTWRASGGWRGMHVVDDGVAELTEVSVGFRYWYAKVGKIRHCEKRGRLAGRQMLDARIPNVHAPAPHDARREPVQLRVCGHFEPGCTPNDPVTARLGGSTSGPIVKCDETFSPLAAKKFHRVGPEVDPSNFASTGSLWVNLSSK